MVVYNRTESGIFRINASAFTKARENRAVSRAYHHAEGTGVLPGSGPKGPLSSRQCKVHHYCPDVGQLNVRKSYLKPDVTAIIASF